MLELQLSYHVCGAKGKANFPQIYYVSSLVNAYISDTEGVRSAYCHSTFCEHVHYRY